MIAKNFYHDVTRSNSFWVQPLFQTWGRVIITGCMVFRYLSVAVNLFKITYGNVMSFRTLITFNFTQTVIYSIFYSIRPTFKQTKQRFFSFNVFLLSLKNCELWQNFLTNIPKLFFQLKCSYFRCILALQVRDNFEALRFMVLITR